MAKWLFPVVVGVALVACGDSQTPLENPAAVTASAPSSTGATTTGATTTVVTETTSPAATTTGSGADGSADMGAPTATDDVVAEVEARRLVVATYGSVPYRCGWIVFPSGMAPEPVPEPSVDIAALLASAGPPGVDQDNFYDIYDWTVVVDTGTWVSLLGYPNTPSRPDFYPASFGYLEFGRLEDRWVHVSSDWCDPVASTSHIPAGTSSVTLLWSAAYRTAMVRLAAGVATAEDREVLAAERLVGSRGPAEWRFDPALPLDRESRLVPIEIRERGCAGGQPPEGREITAVATADGRNTVLRIFVEPVAGGARCPGNPWYPITVQLEAPIGDGRLVDRVSSS